MAEITLSDIDVSGPSSLSVPIEAELNTHGYMNHPDISSSQLSRIVTYIEAMGALSRVVIIRKSENDEGKSILSFSSVADTIDPETL